MKLGRLDKVKFSEGSLAWGHMSRGLKVGLELPHLAVRKTRGVRWLGALPVVVGRGPAEFPATPLPAPVKVSC